MNYSKPMNYFYAFKIFSFCQSDNTFILYKLYHVLNFYFLKFLYCFYFSIIFQSTYLCKHHHNQDTEQFYRTENSLMLLIQTASLLSMCFYACMYVYIYSSTYYRYGLMNLFFYRCIVHYCT